VAAPWVVNEVARELRDRPAEDSKLTPSLVAELIGLLDEGDITAQVGKDLLGEIAASGASPRALVAQRGLDERLDDTALEELVAATLSAHPDELASYRAGKTGLRGFFVGQVMREARGKADPKRVQALVGDALDRG